MVLDQDLRNALRKMVQQARETLRQDLTETLEGTYGVHRSGDFEAATVARLPALKDEHERETRELLERVLPPRPSTKAERERFQESFDAVVRALAFTHLNRLVAFKLLEDPSRKVLKETVGRGPDSRGFKFYLADHPDDEALWLGGQQDAAYEHFLLWGCAQLDREIGVLFDPHDLASRVFPRKTLRQVLEGINDPALAPVWSHEEAVGWVYQYWTPKELREKARKESAAPRNSYEMAFRNQFYTPEYVVRFLAENTLGRIWYEMRSGKTALAERCTYLVIRPDEAPAARPPKDPRELRVIDPACGSGHFLLYSFELLEVIYREAYDDAELGPPLKKDWPDPAAFELVIPRLIVENNLYGIDIDRRAAQLTALTLFLKAKSRSRDVVIEVSHVVCAEPMPGAAGQFDDFKARELPKLDADQRAVVDPVLDGLREHLALAGEAGSLLRAEQELERLIARERAKDAWRRQRPSGTTEPLFVELRKPAQTQLAFGDLTDDQFWREAERTVEGLLRDYALEASGAEGAHRRMFARDGIGVLRFLDVLRQRYDVVLMNPPFGDPTPAMKPLLEASYPPTCADLYAAFIQRTLELLTQNGKLGFITNRTWLGLPQLEGLRSKVLGPHGAIDVAADLGSFVLDAQVETIAAVVGRDTDPQHVAPWIRLLKTKEKDQSLGEAIVALAAGNAHRALYLSSQARFSDLPSSVFGYWLSDQLAGRMTAEGSVAHRGVAVKQGTATADDFRFLRLAWEVPPSLIGIDAAWVPFAKGGEYSPYFDDVHLLLNWADRGVEVIAWGRGRPQNAQYFGQAGVTWPRRTTSPFGPRSLPPGCAFGDKGPSALPQADSDVDKLVLLGLLSSRPERLLLSVRLGAGDDAPGSAAKSYEVGLIRDLPFPELSPAQESLLRDATREAAQAKKASQVEWDETANAFVAPGFLRFENRSSLRMLAEDSVRRFEDLWATTARRSADIDEVMCEALGFSEEDRRVLQEELEAPVAALPGRWNDHYDEILATAYLTKDALPGERLPGGLEAEVDVRVKTRRKKQTGLRSMDALCRIFAVSPQALLAARRRLGLVRGEDLQWVAASLISYAVGAAFGRWDIRLAPQAPDLDPFAVLRRVPHGALVDGLGNPLGRGPAGYPIRVDEDGILVDESEAALKSMGVPEGAHDDDIVVRVREVLRFFWADSAEVIEREACSLLGVRSLRDYFGRGGKGGFWVEHFRRYGKSRRRAPIYWPLQSPQGSYRFWIHYQGLTHDTLPRLLGERYLGGQINRVRHRIEELRPGGKAKPGISKKEERQVSELDDLLLDLEEFAARIRSVVQRTDDRGRTVGYAPDRNDGVILSAAPLHDLIPWPKAVKHQGRTVSELLAYWEKLAAEEYEWARVAMLYWPTRVTAACAKDKSLAIAHGLEADLFPGLRDELRRQAASATPEETLEDDGEGDGEDDDEE